MPHSSLFGYFATSSLMFQQRERKSKKRADAGAGRGRRCSGRRHQRGRPPPSTGALPVCPEGVISNRFMTRCENDRRLGEFIIERASEQISGLFLKTVWTLRILERRIGGRTDRSQTGMPAHGTSYFTPLLRPHVCKTNGADADGR